LLFSRSYPYASVLLVHLNLMRYTCKMCRILAALSTTEKPIPNLISPIYQKGFEESISLLESIKTGVDWWTYGDGLKNAKPNVQDVFDEIIKKI